MQLLLAKEFLLSVQERGVASLLERDVLGTELIRDKFNMKKMLIAASASGKVSDNSLDTLSSVSCLLVKNVIWLMNVWAK